MEEIFPPIKSIGSYTQKFKNSFRKYKLRKGNYRYSLIDVTSQNNEIELHIMLLGIKQGLRVKSLLINSELNRI